MADTGQPSATVSETEAPDTDESEVAAEPQREEPEAGADVGPASTSTRTEPAGAEAGTDASPRAEPLPAEEPAATRPEPVPTTTIEKADEPAAPAPAAPVAAAAPRRADAGRRTTVTIGVAVLIIVVWAVGGWLLVRQHHDAEIAAQRPVVVDAAGKVATDLTSIGAANAAQQLRALQAESTGALHQMVSRYSTALQSVLGPSGSASVGTATSAAIESIDSDKAVVLVALSAKLSNPTSPAAAETIPYRVAVTLQRVDGRWLAGDLEFIK